MILDVPPSSVSLSVSETRLPHNAVRSAVSERQLKLGVFAKNATADGMGGVAFLSVCEFLAFTPFDTFGPWLSRARHAAAAELDGKEIPAGSFVNLTEGQEIVFEDGSRYTVRIDGKVHQQSTPKSSTAWAMHVRLIPAVASRADNAYLHCALSLGKQ